MLLRLLWIVLHCCLLGRVNCLAATSRVSSQRRSYFATTVSGLEKVLQSEVAILPEVSNICIGKGSISFEGTDRTGLEAVLWLRSSLKVMEVISEHGRIDSKSSLDSWLASVKWHHLMHNKQTLKCDTILGQDVPFDLTHSHFTSLSLKNSVVDHFRAATGERPSVSIDDPDVPLLLYLHRGKGKLYRIWSGEASMHKRGYRPAVIHNAALKETTAAALLLLTGWNQHRGLHVAGSDRAYPTVLCDPMCGSGTIAVEAALMAADTAPGLIRYAPQPMLDRTGPSGTNVPLPVSLRWVDLVQESIASVWKRTVSEAQSRDQRASLKALSANPFVYANDHHHGAVDLARQAAQRAGVQHLIDFRCQDAGVYRPMLPPGIIVTNPPWDQRMQGAEDSWQSLATFVSGPRMSENSTVPVGNGSEDGQAEARSAELSAGIAAHTKLALWVLSGNEQLNHKYLRGKPKTRIPFRAASNYLFFNMYSV